MLVDIRWGLFLIALLAFSYFMDWLGDDEMYWLWKDTFKDFP